ncbi:MAG TPA: sulfocyanin-like copper-binding protein [Stellaceae bacterium]|nr:sulfocyanin-like copper-binding protein [Stellaceae bacterium]
MVDRLAAAAAVVVSLLLAPATLADDTHLTPSWMKTNAGAKLVTLNIIAGFNANNGALNYNGYYTGDMTLVVPVGWTVEIDFKNQDAMLPHSLLVTKPYAHGHFPDIAGVNEVAVSRAYTDNPDQGIPSPKTDVVRFVAKNAGDFYFLCGTAGHGQAGMWTNFKIDAAAASPYVTIAPGAEAGRP